MKQALGALVFATVCMMFPATPILAAPVANNQDIGKVGPGKEILFALSYSGSPTSFTILTNPGHGTLRAYGSSYPQYYYYTASAGYEGPDSFTWKCADASGSSGTATCSVTVSAVPTANNQSSTVATGGEILIYLSYSDPMSAPSASLVFTILSPPAHGTLESYNARSGTTSCPNGYYYCPTGTYTGADSFTWKMNNGYHDSGTGTVSITVTPNTIPKANNYSSSANSGTRSSVYLSVTHSDAGQLMTYTLLSGPSHGTLEWPAPAIANGTYAYYTSERDYVGQDSFTWKVNDGFGDSNVATNTLTVNACIPSPQNQSESVPMNVPSVIQAAYTGGGGYTCTVMKVGNPSHGSVTVSGSAFTYTPAADYTGTDSFTWKVRYSNATTPATDTATVTCSLMVRAGIRGTAYDQNVVTLKNTATTVAFARGFCLTPTFSIVQAPAHGTATVSGTSFTYTPAANYTGTDLFTWKMNDGTADSNIATNRVLVRAENSRGGMTVLLVVKDTLLPEITNEVARWKADLENEGYTAKIKPWSSTSAPDLWAYLVSEYFTPGQFVAGATLIGNLPTATGLSTGQTTDYAFMNMLTYRDNGYNKQHIWVSRIYTVGLAGGEVLRAKWAMDANHGYRSGEHRLPYGAYWWDAAYGAVNEANAQNTLIVWPTIQHVYPMDAFRIGGEFENSEIHSDGAFDGFDNHPSQLRYSIHSSCGPGRLGGPINQNACTYGGGLILGVGSTATAYSWQNVVMDDIAYFNALAAGDTFGNGMTRPNLNPYRDFDRDMFYGDLSLPAKAAPSNAVPVISAFTSDRTTGAAPLAVSFAVAAGDPDGTVANYEWFLNGFNVGVDGPLYSGLSTNVSHTFTKAHRFAAEVQAIDNYKARAWKSKEIAVAPTPGQPLRATCGKNLSTYNPSYDYTDLASNLWLHDQAVVAGTWGYSGGNEGYVAQAVAGTEDDALYQSFRTGSSFTYKIPVPNGGYWLRLKLADMQSTAAGQRVMDVTAEGVTQVFALDVYALAGAKAATTVECYVDVADGELTFSINRNAAATADAFLNAFEVIPYTGGNRPPLADTRSLTTMHDTPLAVTLTGSDPDGDAIGFQLVCPPEHGTLSGTPPNLTYTPDVNYVGFDRFLFRANDGKVSGNVGGVTVTVGGLAAWWRLDDAAGTAAADATGLGHTGALQGGAGWTSGKIGGALALTESTNKMIVSPPVSLGSTWTIAAWFTAPLPNTGANHTLTRGQNADHQIMTDSAYKLGVYDNAGGAGFRSCGYNMTNLAAGWHHLAAVGTGTVTTFYIDGVKVGTSDRKSSTDVYAVGNYQSDNQRFADAVDDMRIYNYAISTQEIAALAAVNNQAPTAAATASVEGGPAPLTVNFSAAGSFDPDGSIASYAWSFGDRQGAFGAAASHTYTKPGTYTATLVVTDNKGETDSRTVTIRVWGAAACWTLDEGAGTTAADSACGNHGTLINGPVWTNGMVGGGLWFDGVNDNVTVAAAPYAGLENSFTIAFWARPTAARTATTESTSGTAGTSGQRYAIYPTQGSGAYGAGHAGAGVSVGTNGVSVFEHTDSYLPSVLVHATPLSGWTHVAVVYDRGTPTLYLNGTAVRTGLKSSKTVHPGCAMGGSSYGWYQGALDDVQIYNGGLTPAAILALAAGGVPDWDGDGTPDASDDDDDNDGIPDAWETAYGLNARDGLDADIDSDGDGLSNRQEYIAGTDPRSALSLFKVDDLDATGGVFRLQFLSRLGREYRVQRKDDLPTAGDWVDIADRLPGTGGYLEISDPVTGARRFYRIQVQIAP